MQKPQQRERVVKQAVGLITSWAGNGSAIKKDIGNGLNAVVAPSNRNFSAICKMKLMFWPFRETQHESEKTLIFNAKLERVRCQQRRSSLLRSFFIRSVRNRLDNFSSKRPIISVNNFYIVFAHILKVA